MRKIAIVLRKGGSGKTVTAINLAGALINFKKKVLLIDADPQCGSTLSCGLNPEAYEFTLNNLFLDENLDVKEAIQKTDFGLDVIPSHPVLGETEQTIQASKIGIMKTFLKPIEEQYDYVIIDTPPSDSNLTIASLAYAKEVIIPVQTHYLALSGLSHTIDIIKDVKSGLNDELKIFGILPTMVDDRTNICREILDQLRTKYKDQLLPVFITFTVKHPEASLVGKPLVILAPEHKGAKEYEALARLLK